MAPWSQLLAVRFLANSFLLSVNMKLPIVKLTRLFNGFFKSYQVYLSVFPRRSNFEFILQTSVETSNLDFSNLGA